MEQQNLQLGDLIHCVGCGSKMMIIEDVEAPYPIYCGACEDDMEEEHRARNRSLNKYDEDYT